MLTESCLQGTNQFAHDKLGEELIYIQKIAAHLKLLLGVQRQKKNAARGNSWAFTKNGREWFQNFDILEHLLDAILRAEINNEKILQSHDKQYRFPAPSDFSISTLSFAIRTLSALIFSLKAKMNLVHKMHSKSLSELCHQELTCISPDFPDVILVAEKSEEDLMQMNHWKGTLTEVKEVEETAAKLRKTITLTEE